MNASEGDVQTLSSTGPGEATFSKPTISYTTYSTYDTGFFKPRSGGRRRSTRRRSTRRRSTRRSTRRRS